MKNVEHRKFFVKLGTGNNCLSSEKGRYESLPRKEQPCPHCDMKVKDLEHFMFKCQKLNVQRGDS